MSKFVLTAQLQLQAPTNVGAVVQQIQSQLNGVSVNVQVQNSAKAQQQLQQVGAAANQAASSAERMGKAFALSVRRFAAFSIATRAVGLFTSTLSDAVQTAIDFERQLVKIVQVTGKSANQLRGLTDEISSLSTSLGVSSNSLLEVTTVLAQAGLSANDTSIALNALAKSALAPNFDSITETAEGAIAILAQFKQGVGALERQLSSIDAVAGAFAVEASDLIDVVRRAGGVFKSSGGNLNELLALFTSVRATTRESAESIGTGLRTIFTRIQRPQTIEFLKQFGIELVDLNGKFVGPYEAIRKLSEALSGLGEGDITFIKIAEELGGFRQIGKVLPLLQQFSTAQAALNVAQNAGKGLAENAATAQLALAVRITKVREEFLKLVRDITSTDTFQFMANGALALASALIKIADSIKPLIPLLAAVAAVKLTKGIGSFLGGIGKGAMSGQTFNKGGKVHAFATGGLVPGSGNSDTVPAMLTPGEFVIRKSSVAKLGASNLAAMNENKYASGGVVVDPNKIGAFFLRPEKGTDRSPIPIKGQGNIKNSLALSQLGMSPKKNDARQQTFDNLTKEKQASLLGLSSVPVKKLNYDQLFTTSGKLNITPSAQSSGRQVLRNAGISKEQIDNININSIGKKLNSRIKKGKATLDAQSVSMSGAISGYYPGLDDLQNSNIAKIISEKTKTGLYNTILKSVDPVINSLNNPAISINQSQARKGAKRIANDPNAQATTQGFAFEGLIQSITGAKLAGNQANFDFPNVSAASSSLKNMFTDASGEGLDSLIKADAKRSNSIDAIDSIKNKIVNDINRGKFDGITFVKKYLGGIIQKFAGGGKVNFKGVLYPWSEIERTSALLGMSPQMLAQIYNERVDQDKILGGRQSEKAETLFKKAPMKLVVNSAYDKVKSAVQSKQMERQDIGGRSPEYEGSFKLDKRKRFAVGGNVGTDTVPALLTPGEFVVNKASAQRIGYGNLNRMNKVGKYAKGGFVGVQKFAQGTGTAGVTATAPSGGGSLAAWQAATNKNTQSVQQNTQANADNTDKTSSMADSSFGAFIALGAVTSGLTAITPVIDENSSAFERVTASILNSTSSLITTLGGTIIALQQFGISINAANMASFAQGAVQFLTGAKSLTGVFSSLKNGIPGVNNFISSLKMGAQGAAGPMLPGSSSIGYKVGAGITQARAGLNNFGNNIGQGLKNTGTKIGGGFSYGFDQGKAGASASSIAKSVQQTMSQYGSGGRLTTSATGLSARLGTYAGNVAGSGFGQAVGGAANATKQFIGGQLSKSPIANFVGKAGSNALAGFKGGLAGKAIIGGGSTSIAANAGGFAGKGLNIAGNAISNLTTTLRTSLTKVTTGLNAAAGPLLAIQVASTLAAGAINAYLDYQGQANKAIQEGNVVKAAEMSTNAAAQESIDTIGSSAILAGAAIGSIVPGVGTVIGALAGATVALGTKFLPSIEKAIFGTDYVNKAFIKMGTYIGGNTYDSIQSMAAAQAQGAKVEKELASAAELTTQALQDFENGTKSAAETVAASRSAGTSVMQQKEINRRAITDNEKNKTTSGLDVVRRNVLTVGGLLGETAGTRNARIDKENKALQQQTSKSEQKLIETSSPALNKFSSEIAAAGGTFDDVLKNLNDSASAAYNPGLYQALISQGTGPLRKSFENIAKEVDRAKAAFEAMDLGMQNVQGAASAAALGVNNYIASQQAGNIKLEQSLSVLEASVTSAAQGISDVDFEAALGNAEKTLKGFGASDKQISKFSGNLRAVNEIQKNQSAIFADTKDKLATDIRKSTSADQRRKVFSETVTKRLEEQGYSPEVVKRFKDASANMSDDQLKEIGKGNFTAFEEAIGDLGKKTLEQVNGPLKAAIEIQKQLNELTKQRIEAERNLMAAQMEAADVRMEALDIQAKYGGDIVTPEMRSANIVQKANIQTTGISGVSALRTGSAAEINQRTSEIRQRQAEIANVRNMAAAGNQGAQDQLEGQSGIRLQEEEKRLAELSKGQIQTTRELIKAKEDELKIVKEKNQLEKGAADALVSGDIMKFFEQQSAVGAQAAIATGDQTLMNQFGSSALGMAAQDMRRQQEAGVQDLYGQKLAGPGGLTERAYGAAISSTGVQNPTEMARVAAGTTAEEAGIESDIRDLAGTMGPSADLQVSAANQQLQAAQLQLQAATARQQEAVDQMGARQMSRGGPVYASRGIFVPRGTDTVPAMLTPGEFVVRREAVNRGNNLQILQSMNRGSQTAAVSSNAGGAATMASGGIVKYRQKGSTGPEGGGGFGINPEIVNKFVEALNNFNTQLSDNITRLSDTKFQISLSPTNINVNLNGTSFLENLTSSIKQDLINFVGQEISNYSVGNDGKLKKSGKVLSPD
jgi:TP901 family phage tail tape measure protein